MSISIYKDQQKADYAIRRHNRAKKNSYIGEKLAASVNVEGVGTVDRVYTCVATYPYFARFSYETRSGVILYECFDYTDVDYIREFKKVSNSWIRDFNAG